MPFIPSRIELTANGVTSTYGTTLLLSTTSPVTFDGQLYGSGGVPVTTGVTYAWTFGDGTSSTLKTPGARSFADGVYSVEIQGTSSTGTYYGQATLTITGGSVIPPGGASDSVAPADLPGLRSTDTHSFEAIDISRQMKYESGGSRGRQIFTSVPEVFNGAWDMNQAQLDSFDTWYEAGLFAGTREFDVRVVDQGTNIGTTWTKAKFIAPPETESINGGTYVVRCQFLLLGSRFTTRTPPSLRGAATIAVDGNAHLEPATTLFGAATVAINGKSRLTS